MAELMEKGLMETDAPLADDGGDRLGFAKIAEELAASIKAQPADGGLVIGIEGAWGSGKTSLVELVFSQLPDVSTLRFLPWLVGGRDALLHELFASLADALPHDANAAKNRKLRDNLRMFSKLARGAEFGLSLFNQTAARAAGAASKGLDAAATPSLVRLREEIRESLKDTGQKIIVFIDDLDRLEPQDTLEVLRLVKAVADFPNITYLVAFDPETTARALEKAGMTDGRAFLEKIIQVSFRLPAPEPWDLTSWLAEAARNIAGRVDDRQAARIQAAAQRIGEVYLNTPRDVVRVLNHFRLHYQPLAGKVDPGDLLFLQIVRIKAPALPGWIEGYVATLARLHEGGVLDNDAPLDGAKKLKAALGVEPDQQGELLGRMRRFLPGISGNTVELAGAWADIDLPEPEKDRLMSTPRFEAARTGFLKRLERATPGDLAQNPQFVHILYAWLQGGAEARARDWVAQNTKSDADLLTFLESIRSWSSAGLYLNIQELGNFLDIQKTRTRLEDMGGVRAGALLAVFHRDTPADT